MTANQPPSRWPSLPAASSRPPCDLVRYLAGFGWTLADLGPAQLLMVLAARNAAGYIEGLEIPVASRPDAQSGGTLAEKETLASQEMTAYSDRWISSRIPADEMDVAQANTAEDLPRLFPGEWILEDVQPTLFYSRFAAGELRMPVWERPTRGPQDAQDSVRRRELAESATAADTSKQHAYVLLDTSRTMNDHDRRGTIARGVALAFLRNGYEQRARMSLRPFTAEVGEISSGVSRDDLRAIARRVVELPNAGQTRIQVALETAVADIRHNGPFLRADILLITDGISRLSKKPLAEERLHTFVLGDLLESEGEASTVATLRQWSTTFHRLWNNRFPEILAPTAQDLRAASSVLQQMLDRCREDPTGAICGEVERVLANVRHLHQEFRRAVGKDAPVPPEIAALEKQWKDAEPQFGTLAAPAATSSDRLPLSEAVQPSTAQVAGSSGEMSASMGLWTWIRQLVVQAWRWAIRPCRRLFSRRS